MSRIRQELNKLDRMPPWGRPQGNNWDQLSNFIYRVNVLDGLRRQAIAKARAERLDEAAFLAYVIRRWYNFHTHQEIFKLICDHPSVYPEANSRHHTIDFYLRDLPFDLKLSRFPRAYPRSLDEALANPADLIAWQYRHQSQEWRYHAENRLFVIFHHRAAPDQTWQLRREFDRLTALLHSYLDAPLLYGVSFEDKAGLRRQPWAGIIFCIAGQAG